MCSSVTFLSDQKLNLADQLIIHLALQGQLPGMSFLSHLLNDINIFETKRNVSLSLLTKLEAAIEVNEIRRQY